MCRDDHSTAVAARYSTRHRADPQQHRPSVTPTDPVRKDSHRNAISGTATANLLPYVVDAAESKQGKFLPGSHLPVVPPAALRERRPDIVLILPWNIADEIVERHSYVRDWGGRFAVAVPEITFL